MEKIENEFGETWEKVEDPELLDFIETCLEGTADNKFSIDYIAKVIEDEVGDELPNEYQPNTRYIIHLWGGRNGDGKWDSYFADMISIFTKLNKKFGGSTYLVDLKNDCADDVFDMRIGASL